MAMALPSKPRTTVATPTATLMAELEALREENAALRKARESRLTLKVSAKGAVSLYGLGRWPVTLYAEQWNRVESLMPQITAFIREHAGELSVKGA